MFSPPVQKMLDPKLTYAWSYVRQIIRWWWTMAIMLHKKKWTNFGTFPKGGGGQGPIQSKRGTFCHKQVPTRIYFILPHIHGGASLFIPHKFYPWTLTMCWVIKNNIKNVDLKSATRWSKVQGGGQGSLGKVPKLVRFFFVQLPLGCCSRYVILIKNIQIYPPLPSIRIVDGAVKIFFFQYPSLMNSLLFHVLSVKSPGNYTKFIKKLIYHKLSHS